MASKSDHEATSETMLTASEKVAQVKSLRQQEVQLSNSVSYPRYCMWLGVLLAEMLPLLT